MPELGFDTRDYSAAPESRDKIEQAVVAVPRNYQPSEAARNVVYSPVTGFATKPFAHQQRGLCELIDNDHWALFWKMGTGKSAAIVYRLMVGFYYGDFSRVLILCPFGVIDTWIEQLKTHGPLTGYRFGGKNPEAGLDCSGMVSYVFDKAAGVKLIGSAADMARQGRPVEVSQLQPGDLLFFNTLNRPHSHVGIYIGDGRFIHAPSSAGKIRTENLREGWFAPRFEEARSYLD